MIAIEPAAADDAARAFNAGHTILSMNPKTVADDLLTSLGDLTFPVIEVLVDDIVTVSEESILKARRLVWEVIKLSQSPQAPSPTLRCWRARST